jgi:hypothetical protein
MSSILNDTMKTAKNGVGSAKEHAEHALGTAKSAVKDTEHTIMSALSTLLKGASTVASVVSMLRSLDVDDGLSWFGLARRRRPLRSLAIFGAGLAMGAGVGVLFAPTSGADMRRALLGGTKDLKREVKQTIERVESEVVEAAEAVKGVVTHKAADVAANRPS